MSTQKWTDLERREESATIMHDITRKRYNEYSSEVYWTIDIVRVFLSIFLYYILLQKFEIQSIQTT